MAVCGAKYLRNSLEHSEASAMVSTRGMRGCGNHGGHGGGGGGGGNTNSDLRCSYCKKRAIPKTNATT